MLTANAQQPTSFSRRDLKVYQSNSIYIKCKSKCYTGKTFQTYNIKRGHPPSSTYTNTVYIPTSMPMLTHTLTQNLHTNPNDPEIKEDMARNSETI